MRILFSLLVFANFAGAADFIVPKQQIVGAEQVIPLGELVTLSVSPPEPTPFLIATKYDWKVFDGNFAEKKFAVDSSGQVFFGAGVNPKTMLAVLAITHTYEVKDSNPKQFSTKTILISTPVQIGDEGPEDPPPGPPSPQPPPAPAPTPPQPEPAPEGGITDKFGFGKIAFDAAISKVAVTGRKQGRPLGESFGKVAEQIKSGALTDVKAIFAATKTSNDKALGNQAGAWKAWSAILEENIFKLSEAGKVSAPADYYQLWIEIANGLSQITGN